MLVANRALRIVQATGLDGQLLARRTRIGRIDIELKIRHNKEMIPQLVGVVGRIAQQGKEVTHHGNHGTRLAVTLVAIFDQQERIDHLVDVAPVLGQVQLASCVIIVLFHRFVVQNGLYGTPFRLKKGAIDTLESCTSTPDYATRHASPRFGFRP